MSQNKTNKRAEPTPLNPALSHQAMYHMLNYLNTEVHAYDVYTADLERQIRDAEWRATTYRERADMYREETDRTYSRLARVAAGGETVVMALDNMYNLFITMARDHPEIGSYHEQLQRIILHAESGRRLLSDVIDLTTDDEEDEIDIDEEMLEHEREQEQQALANLAEASMEQYIRTANGYDEVVTIERQTYVIDLTDDE